MLTWNVFFEANKASFGADVKEFNLGCCAFDKLKMNAEISLTLTKYLSVLSIYIYEFYVQSRKLQKR